MTEQLLERRYRIMGRKRHTFMMNRCELSGVWGLAP